MSRIENDRISRPTNIDDLKFEIHNLKGEIKFLKEKQYNTDLQLKSINERLSKQKEVLI